MSADALCRAWRTPGVGAVSCSSTGPGGYRAPGFVSQSLVWLSEAGSDPRGHLGVTWGVYLCAGKPPLADIILSHPPDLTRCDSVIGLAIPAMSGHIQYRGTASGDLCIGISGINRGFYHNVSVIFQPSVLMVNVSATVSWLAILR